MRAFFQRTVDECRQHGFVTTAFGTRTFVSGCRLGEEDPAHQRDVPPGRRRDLPAIHHPDRGVRAHAERQAKNTVCQGSAADLVKAAMVHLHRRLETERLVRTPCDYLPPSLRER